tara:strand:- start:52 stop:621 length:570 start_codon:yes stop_codon:yes gene_type:complete
MSVLEEKVLVLDRGYQPVHVVSAKSAIYLLFREVGKVIDDDWSAHTLDEWIEKSKGITCEKPVRTPRYSFPVPNIVLLRFYVKKNLPMLKCNKSNICLRDNWHCGYCNKRMRERDCTIDHIVPVSQGGITEWKNVVISCSKCNNRKGNRTIEESGLELKTEIYTPNWSKQILKRYIGDDNYHPWKSFLR